MGLPPSYSLVNADRQVWAATLPPRVLDGRYRHVPMNLSVARVLRDAREGVAATGRLFVAALRHPFGAESVSWRRWALPWGVVGLSLAVVASVAFGHARWLDGLLLALALALLALLLFARLGRRHERLWPGT